MPDYTNDREGLARRLRTDSEFRMKLKQRLLDQITASEKAMARFYSRWRANENRVQAYITLPDYEQQLKLMNNKGEPPKITQITVPYAFATQATIVTYLLHTFASRKPMFQVGTYKDETVQSARMMETVLQYNGDHVRIIRQLYQYFSDMELYGVGIIRGQWKDEYKWRTSWTQPGDGLGGTLLNSLGLNRFVGQPRRVRERRLVFQGTEAVAVDPFCFLPDPRVPMYEVNERGEFVYWRSWENYHSLLTSQGDGEFFNVDTINRRARVRNEGDNMSNRSRLSMGDAQPGAVGISRRGRLDDNIQLDQGTVSIRPKEWGLGEGNDPEKWIFTLANKDTVIQAEPFDADHGKHPVAVSEPYSLGYGFGQPGLSDYLGPVQDAMSWFLNSHIKNVRSSLNNIFLVNPSAVETQDLEDLDEGGIIRLKQSAMGADVRSVFQQLNVQDVTSGHVNDLEMFMRMGDILSSVNDNLRGIQASGGRKTATEVRTSGESAASRLAAHARLISAQGIVDLTEMMSTNYQQFLDMDFYLQIVGQAGMEAPIHIEPSMLTGDFHYPIHDGTLPLDRVALLDIWKEIYAGIAADPQMRMRYDLAGIFEWMAELSGAQGLERFKLDVGPAPNEPMPLGQDPMQTGNAVGLQEALADLGGGAGSRMF